MPCVADVTTSEGQPPLALKGGNFNLIILKLKTYLCRAHLPRSEISPSTQASRSAKVPQASSTKVYPS